VVKNLRIYGNEVISKHTIHNLVHTLKRHLEFSITNLEISFVDETEMSRLNKKHKRHAGSTDILTFDYSKSKSSIDGEIIISIDDALKNAKKFRVSKSNEIIRLVIHGILHLLGYNDETKAEKSLMRRKENLLIRKFKLSY
jgi:rRNA maturation RNase YbeY